MEITNKHFEILKDFLEYKIDAKDIKKEDKAIIFELCKARKKQLQKKVNGLTNK